MATLVLCVELCVWKTTYGACQKYQTNAMKLKQTNSSQPRILDSAGTTPSGAKYPATSTMIEVILLLMG